jgi:hypothetical protein
VAGKGFVALAVGLLLVAAVAGLGVGAFLGGAAGRDDTGTGGGPGATASRTPGGSGSIVASADRGQAAPYERVTISGQLSGGEAGVELVVQRREDGDAWADLPARVTTGAGGSYQMSVQLGRPGENVLRIAAPSTGAVSEPLTITIG